MRVGQRLPIMRIRRWIPVALTLGLLLLVSLAPFPYLFFASHASPSPGTSSVRPRAVTNYSKLPISFEANQGQANSPVRFLAHGPGYSLFLTPQEALLALNTNAHRPPDPRGRFSPAIDAPSASASASSPTRIGMRFLNANPQPKMTGEQSLPGIVNYLLGNDPAKWHTNIPTYAQVRYHDLYPGIDLMYYSNQGRLEYAFIVAPGSDPSRIHLGFTGANYLSLDTLGELLLHLPDGDIPEGAPHVYQEINGARQEIVGSYVLQRATEVGFRLGAYNTSQPLIIDPLVFFSTYLGGVNNDNGAGIAVDSQDNAYIAGFTSSANFPSQTPQQATFGGGASDAFITKINATGTALVYSTYLGGSDADAAYGIAVDSSGNAYVTGITSSTNFPIQNALQPTFGGGPSDAFVAEINATGTALVYSTYLGGSDADAAYGIAVDSSGNAYVTGITFSMTFPTQNALQPTFGGGFDDAFVTKISATGSALVYSTYLGGNGADWGNSIAVDSAGNAYITGGTGSTNFPTHNPVQSANAGTANAFLTKINPSGSTLVYSTYLGGSNYDYGSGIAVDSAGNAYITGSTRSTNFPTHNPVQSANAGSADAFVTKINAAGSALVYSTYLGGRDADWGNSIAVDSAGNATITGVTRSTNFPTRSALQAANAGGVDAFIASLDTGGSALLYSGYLGGQNNDEGNSIALDSAGNAYAVGATASFDFPTANPLQPYGGMEDAFLVKIDLAPPSQFHLSTGDIALTTTPGVSPSPQTLTLSNTGAGTLAWSASFQPSASWVSVSPTSGTLAPGSSEQLTLTFTISNTTPQTYTTTLILSDPNASNSPVSLPITVVAANVSKTWYFAEGYTGRGYSEYLTLANPNAQPAQVQVTYLLGSGPPLQQSYTVGAQQRATLLVNNAVGPNQNVSLVVTATVPIVAERPMYFTYHGFQGLTVASGSDVLGATQLATQFAFGYLDTTANHQTWLTILNQNSQTMTVTITYFPAPGGPGTTVTHAVAANSRGTVYVNNDVPAGSYSALVTLSAPGLVERPLYLKDSQTGYPGAPDVVGVSQPQPSWYFAEGYTAATFSERYLLSNPGSQTAHATVTFFRSDGSTAQQVVTLGPGQQAVVNANRVLGSTNVSNSAKVTADQPILAERFMSFSYPGLGPGATDVLGTSAPSGLFYFAEGYTANHFTEFLTLENPSASAVATVQVTFLPAGGSAPVVRVYTLAPSSRFTLNAGSVMPNQAFSMAVESTVPIVAERPLYFNYFGLPGGSDIVGYQP